MATVRRRTATQCMAALILLSCALVAPATASADGPTTPVATTFLARVRHTPPGVTAKVVDGWVQLWMSVSPRDNVEVLDQLGAPYVRFDSSGVFVNHNSILYYVSQVPVPELPPKNLTGHTPPHWFKVSSGHAYMWRDGRLHADTQEALAPGTRYIGRWQIALRVNGSPGQVSGGISYYPAPSPVWFWPIAVMILCVFAAWRLRSPRLDNAIRNTLVGLLLAALAVGAVARELHGRPHVSTIQVVLLVLELAAIAVATGRLVTGRSGHVMSFITAFLSLWVGLTFLPVLTHHYVMLALPGLPDRIATVVLLGGSLSLVLVSARLLGTSMAAERAARRKPVTA
jgi:hypothetical protein